MDLYSRSSVWIRCGLGLGIATAVAASLTAQTAGPSPTRSAVASCESLTALSLPNATITLAERIANGAPLPSPPATGDDDAPPARAATAPRAFCRVAATLKPSADSDIKMELWLPAEWNGKFNAVGNGAFNGNIAYPALRTSLVRGYAAASTDTGHTGNSASFALGHPEKLVDFGWRAVHETAETSKRIIKAYYDAPPRLSYWTGCSAGGRQGMKAAQQFPADFDGIVAGAPGLDWTGRAAQALHGQQQYLKDPAVKLTPDDLRLLHTAAMNACDTKDGLKDGLIADPMKCSFDPAVLQCKGAAGASCLSASQVAIAKEIYAARSNPSSRRVIGGLQPGSELGWTELGWTGSARATGLSQFRFIVHANPAWEISQFNFDRDIVRADEVGGETVNALNYDLRPFLSRGGKLIQYHGWADPQISPQNSVDYYTQALKVMGGEKAVSDGYRLFMAPGMGHCAGGDGPNTFDTLTALEQWVEQKKAPDAMLASHAVRGVVDRTRPLCPYPQIAVYNGSGSVDEAANFSCRRQ